MEYHLAQINIARMLAPTDSLVMKEFMENLDYINGLAEKSDGFVWRLKDDVNNATSIRVYNDDFIIVNMSVWVNGETLSRFVYQTAHTDFLKRRRQWFEKMDQQHMVLWYVPAGHNPTVEEAVTRLNYIRENGETPFGFGFRSKFTPEEALAYC